MRAAARVTCAAPTLTTRGSPGKHPLDLRPFGSTVGSSQRCSNVIGLARPRAVKLGERMVEAGIPHHVADDHDFKDGEFSYRDYVDE